MSGKAPPGSRRDAQHYKQTQPPQGGLAVVEGAPFLRGAAMQMILRLHRLSAWLHRARLSALSRAVDGVSRVLFAASVPGRARIGKNVFLHHSGLGVVINGLCVIEDDCEIGVHVVLGGRAPEIGAPHLERGVIVHAGACIVGPLRIGAGAVVGANAVVLADVPAGCLAVGVPALVKRLDLDARSYAHRASPR